MSDNSGRLGLPYIRAGQLQKHVTLNEAMLRLDALVQMALQSRSLNTPPAMVEEGQLFLTGPSPAGAWAGFAPETLVMADIGGWRQIAVTDGMMATVLDEGLGLVRLNGAWANLAQAMGRNLSVERMGVGADADANNPFSARLNKALWAARPSDDGGDGDIRFTFNKQSASHTATLLFQSNWSGRAELGLAGDEDLRLKVSANGSSWHEALRVDRTNGRLWFPKGATRREVSVLTASGSFTVPDWARWIEAVCIGGGGGGGAGQFASSGLRRGGGGGGAGGYSRAFWSVEHLGAALAVTIGSAGSGGAANHGTEGGDTTVSTYSNVILKAAGGQGGRLGGVAGSGGLGVTASNAGGANGSNGVPETAIILHSEAPGAGGAGGGLSAANEVFAGGAGSAGGAITTPANGGNGGNGAQGSVGGASSLTNINRCGGGGGGGGARTGGAGFSGGAGGGRGAGGGGGGAGTTAGGAGGAGTAGLVILTVVG